MSEATNNGYGLVHDFDDAHSSTRTRFRFKSHKRAREAEDAEDDGDVRVHRKKRRSHDERRAHRSHRTRRQQSPSRAEQIPAMEQQDPMSPSGMNNEAAFRESLFDALADEEGEDYWQSVYGQPIHTYPDTFVDKETGKLERMTEEEYTEFVRTKMWEKTHQHVLEERARREAAARKAKEESERARRDGDRMAREREEFSRRMEESLRRGEERRAGKTWREAWKRYLKQWEDVLSKGTVREDDANIEGRIPWPVVSGKSSDVNAAHVTAFFEHTPADQLGSKGLKDYLKRERIRWHPDKMQQRLRGRLPPDTLQSVTAVFQLIDDIWTKT